MKAKVLIGILAVAVLSGAVYWFAMWDLGRGFKKADPQGLLDLFEAKVGGAVTVTEGKEHERGAIQYYQEHPEELQRDKRYFETYLSALMIATSVKERGQGVEAWASSTKLESILESIPPSNRTDTWGHAFCVRSSPERIVVISPGAQAIGSLDCGTLDIPEGDLAKMPPGRLNVQPSGALVLVLAVESRTGKG